MARALLGWLRQGLVWLLAGSAIWRLWDSQDTWLWWTLVALVTLDFWITATAVHVARAGDLDFDLRVWIPVHVAVTLLAIGLGVYGNIVA